MSNTDLFDLHDGHRQRLRDRIMRGGLEDLAPHELVEFLLYYVVPRQDVNDLAHRLLERFANLQGILGTSEEELLAVEGMNDRIARWFCLIQQCAAAYDETLGNEAFFLKNYADVFHYALRLKARYRPSCAVQLCLDRDGQLLYQSSFSSSPRWGTPEAFREALNDAVCSEAKGIIILIYTHQHTPVASFYDITHARSYEKLMTAANCTLLDVVLVGSAHLSSMRRSGLIAGQKKSALGLALREDYLRGMPAQELFPVEDYQEFEGER